MNWYYTRYCHHCKPEFKAKRYDQKYCSGRCRTRAYRQKQRREHAAEQLSSLSVAEAVALQLLEDRAPGTRQRLVELIAEYDLAAGQTALRLAAHVAGVKLDDA